MTTTCRTRAFLTGPLVHDTLDVSTRLCAQAGPTTSSRHPASLPSRCGSLSAQRDDCGVRVIEFFSTSHQPTPSRSSSLHVPRSDGAAPHRAHLRSPPAFGSPCEPPTLRTPRHPVSEGCAPPASTPYLRVPHPLTSYSHNYSYVSTNLCLSTKL
ncbi:hypothetical protein DFH06DRAFT_1345184 [Mycena polygramma]|nr:hypothetical protein DFH06DRAFT_1345184 [Mycena polygramma]